jgi:hypothetical protein
MPWRKGGRGGGEREDLSEVRFVYSLAIVGEPLGEVTLHDACDADNVRREFVFVDHEVIDSLSFMRETTERVGMDESAVGVAVALETSFSHSLEEVFSLMREESLSIAFNKSGVGDDIRRETRGDHLSHHHCSARKILGDDESVDEDVECDRVWEESRGRRGKHLLIEFISFVSMSSLSIRVH